MEKLNGYSKSFHGINAIKIGQLVDSPNHRFDIEFDRFEPTLVNNDE